MGSVCYKYVILESPPVLPLVLGSGQAMLLKLNLNSVTVRVAFGFSN